MDEIAEILDMDVGVIENIIKNHLDETARYEKLMDYYMGEHEILSRVQAGPSTPNNMVVANHAKYITTMLTGYFMGEQVSFVASVEEADDSVALLNELYRARYVGTHDYLTAKRSSILGVGYELIYIDEEEEMEWGGMYMPKFHQFDPATTFLIHDIDLEKTVRGAVHYVNVTEDLVHVHFYTDDEVYVFETDDIEGEYELLNLEEGSNPSPHLFGGVPVIRYDNEENRQGDFEQVITLIDVYNLLQSDRINDKEQLVDAIMVITGGKMPAGGMAQLKKERLLNLPGDGMKAAWLTKSMNEVEVEVLKNSIKKDIHEFSFTPNLTDENFAGTTSGEAMKFKLFGTEQVLQEKETFFEKGLRLRMKRLFNYLGAGSTDNHDYTQVKIGFNRALPTDMPNPVETINYLRGVVSDETLLGLLDFVEDVPGELEKVRAQTEAKVQTEASAFDFPSAPSDDEGEEVVDEQ